MTNYGDISKHFQEKYAKTFYPFKVSSEETIDFSHWVKLPVNF